MNDKIERVTTDCLAARLARLPSALARLLGETAAEIPRDVASALAFDVTGIGASEGPARLVVHELARAGLCARFVPLVAFAHETARTERALLVFSQGLCPNVRLALDRAGSYRRVVLFTAASLDPEGPLAEVHVVRHPAENESGTLVRFVGPSVAALAGLLFVRRLLAERGVIAPDLGRLEEVPGVVQRVLERDLPVISGDLSAIVTTGCSADSFGSLAWKWQEGVLSPLVPCFDVLSFVHGPFQAFHDRDPQILVVRSEADVVEAGLFERLERLFSNVPHRFVELRATLPGALAWFEFDVWVDRLVLDAMRRRGLDPSEWPARGEDGALYRFGEAGAA